jgi:hypothetical protein
MARSIMGIEEGLYSFSSLDYEFQPAPVRRAEHTAASEWWSCSDMAAAPQRG